MSPRKILAQQTARKVLDLIYHQKKAQHDYEKRYRVVSDAAMVNFGHNIKMFNRNLRGNSI